MADMKCCINESVSGGIQNMPKVYFCCHPDDFEEHFQMTKAEIYQKYPKISFWYYDKDDEPESDKIDHMNLMIIIVSNRFLEEYSKADYSCYKALKLARERHIPLLPLLQEGVPVESYSQVFGHSQYLEKSGDSSFAIPYEEKLKKRLEETLLNSEERKRIEDAFVAIAFLSYRKKDRKFVNEIMERIHSDEKYRDVGIWYDEFLTPGEEFDKEIEGVLAHSDLFVLMVTANLLEKGNYVMECEYPKAVEQKIPMLSIKCAKTDDKAFRDIFSAATDLCSIDDAAQISAELCGILKDKLENTKEDEPRHLYLMGSAYLYGFDVEKNSNRALELLTKAANLGCNEAYERLTSVYHNGDGVAADYEKSIVWQYKYVEKLRKELSDEESKVKLFVETKKLAESIMGRLRYDEAKKVYKEALEVLKQLKCEKGTELKVYEYEIYSELGDSIRLKASDMKKALNDAEVQEAKQYYLHALEICEGAPEKQAMQYANLGGLLYQLAEFIILEETEEKQKGMDLLDEAEIYCKKALEIGGFERDTQAYDILKLQSIISDKLAGIYRLRDQYDETLTYFEKSLEIWDKFQKDYPSQYHEEGYALAFFNYADTLYNLGKNGAERELLKVAKLIRELYDKNEGLTPLGIITGYKVNYRLALIYRALKDEKKFQYHKNAMEKFERWLSRAAR